VFTFMSSSLGLGFGVESSLGFRFLFGGGDDSSY
jgi:hypothetical protein